MQTVGKDRWMESGGQQEQAGACEDRQIRVNSCSSGAGGVGPTAAGILRGGAQHTGQELEKVM